ncbi:MAG: energy transducer TonB [Bacteroidota bacterium]
MEQKTDNRDAKRQIAGVAGTIIFHGLLVLLLWFAMLKTPLPPWPDAGGGGGGLGIEVNLGNSDNGMGISEANIAFPEFKEQAKDIINPEPVDLKAKDPQESVITDETSTENATSLKTNKENKTNKTEVKTEEVKINKTALFQKNNSDGNTNKIGNQGDLNGNANSKNYTKGGGSGTGQGTGNGSGTGPGNGSGSGGGTGSGTGPGTGPGKGPGISFSLTGRTNKVLPHPSYNSKNNGTVVVKIWVNKNGVVTRVQAGVSGTTTTDLMLWKQAEEAAQKSTFSGDPNAPEEQTGTITYRFIHQN